MRERIFEVTYREQTHKATTVSIIGSQNSVFGNTAYVVEI